MADLTRDAVGATIFKLALPMSIGIAANMSYNIADTFFIGQVGQTELEAVSFTFPVIMALFQIAIGFGIAITSVVSRSVGSQSTRDEGYLGTASLLLICGLALFFCILGLLTVDPLFTMLGAPADLMSSIDLYLNFLYPAMAIQMITMVASNIFRAHGDTVRPSIIMVGAAAVNTALDPLLIFGFGVIPALGLFGAGLASLMGNSLACVAVLALLWRSQLCEVAGLSWKLVSGAWRRITVIGVPAAASNVVNPIAFAVVTAIIANYGAEAVAGYGVAGRIEAFVAIPMLALTGGLSPFVGQNFGRKKFDRIEKALQTTSLFTLIYVSFCAVLLAFFARECAELFTSAPASIDFFVRYIRVIPITLVGYGILIIVCSCYNAIGTPLPSLWLTSIRMLLLYAPLAWIGSFLGEIDGLIYGIGLANILAGILAFIWGRKDVKKLESHDGAL